MNKAIGIIVFSALIATAVGYSVNATQISINTPVSGVVGLLTTTTYGFPDLYYTYIPENALNIIVTISVPSGSACSYLYLYYNRDSFPCASDPPTGDSDYFCRLDTDYTYASAGSTGTSTLYTYTDSFVAGDNFYLGVAKYYSSDATDICPYVIQVNVTTCAENNTVATDSTTCSPVTPLSFTTQTVNVNTTGSVDGVYSVMVPAMTGSIHFTGSFVSSAYVYASRGRAYSSTSYADCYGSTSYNSATSSYLLDFFCDNPQAGLNFISVDSGTVGTLTITPIVCQGGAVGPYCNSTFFDASTVFTAGGASVNIPYGGSAYGYIDISTLALTDATTIYFVGNANYGYFRLGGFPDTSDSYRSFSSSGGSNVIFSPFDTTNFGTGVTETMLYFLIDGCSVTAGCTARLATTVVVPSTTGMPVMTPTTGSAVATPTTGTVTPTPTTGTVTPTPTTGVRVTTGLQVTTRSMATTQSAVSVTTNAAFSVMPSLIAVVIAVIVLVF